MTLAITLIGSVILNIGLVSKFMRGSVGPAREKKVRDSKGGARG